MTSVLLAALTGKGIKRRRASKDWVKILVKLCMVSLSMKTDAKKNLKPCQILLFEELSKKRGEANNANFLTG